MPRYVVDVCFKGTNYAGWQIQPNCVTVQSEVDSAMSKVLRSPVETYGAGRTDSGVHATKLPAHFDFDGELPAHFLLGVNSILPRDISIARVYRALTPEFHARFSGRERAYRYNLIFKKDPIRYGFSRWVKEDVDIAKMMSAAKILLEYDSYECFCKTNSNNKTFICNVKESYFEWEGDMLVYHIRANRFLRSMVRSIVGTMLYIGRGLLTEDDLRQLIEAKDRTKSGPSEQADGLFLTDVIYPEGSLEEIIFAGRPEKRMKRANSLGARE
jgi:tRNA pseudouridine38-40 synthase